jgi:hypothetical protein
LTLILGHDTVFGHAGSKPAGLTAIIIVRGGGMIRKLIALGMTLLVASATSSLTGQDPKYSIKDVMKKAHGGGRNSLFNKVANGQGSDADKAKLVEYYQALPLGKPPKGDAGSYKKLAESLLAAAQEVKTGGTNSAAKLKRAADCMGCHRAHKP